MMLYRLYRSTSPGKHVLIETDGHEPALGLGSILRGAGFEPVSESSGVATVKRVRTLADTVGAGMRVLVCGLNPSLTAADAGFGFAGASNRFWPAAVEAGLVSNARDPVRALAHDDVGMTDLVKRATARASELERSEYADGLDRVERLVEWLKPGIVLFVGLAGWRAAADPKASPGEQRSRLGGRPLYLMPSTSGLNARTSLPELVEHMRSTLQLVNRVTPPPHNVSHEQQVQNQHPRGREPLGERSGPTEAAPRQEPAEADRHRRSRPGGTATGQPPDDRTTP